MNASDPRRQLLLELLQAGLRPSTGAAACARRSRASCPRGPGVASPPSARPPAPWRSARTMCWARAIERTLIISRDHLAAWTSCRRPASRSGSAAIRCPMSARSPPASGCSWFDGAAGAAQPVFLISGGASSLVEVLQPGATLAGPAAAQPRGLASGVAIGELNARRSAISRIKGGGLTARLGGRAALALFVSDVPGDDPAVIGCGLLGPAEGRRPRRAARGGARRACAQRSRARGGRAADLRCRPAARFAGDADRLAVRLTHELCLSAGAGVRLGRGVGRAAAAEPGARRPQPAPGARGGAAHRRARRICCCWPRAPTAPTA